MCQHTKLDKDGICESCGAELAPSNIVVDITPGTQYERSYLADYHVKYINLVACVPSEVKTLAISHYFMPFIQSKKERILKGANLKKLVRECFYAASVNKCIPIDMNEVSEALDIESTTKYDEYISEKVEQEVYLKYYFQQTFDYIGIESTGAARTTYNIRRRETHMNKVFRYYRVLIFTKEREIRYAKPQLLAIAIIYYYLTQFDPNFDSRLFFLKVGRKKAQVSKLIKCIESIMIEYRKIVAERRSK